jgi:tetratricopeptide (TPR) repeat protein
MSRSNAIKVFIIVMVILAATAYVYYRALDLKAKADGSGAGDARSVEDAGSMDLVEAPKAADVPDKGADAADAKKDGISFFLEKARENREAGNRAKACEYARQAVSAARDDAEIWLFEGYCALEQGMPKDAVEAFSRAKGQGVERMDLAVIGLAESFRRQNKIKTALKHYEVYLAEFPDGPDTGIAKKQAKAISLCLEDAKACTPDLRKPAPLSFW